MASTAEKWTSGPNFGKLLANDPGVLGRMARTKFIDETPMNKRETGVTNSIDGKGGAMTRRDFLWLSLVTATTAACARFLLKPTGEDTQAITSLEPAPKFQELGIILSEVRILNEMEAATEEVTTGVTTDLTFKLMEAEFRNSAKHPDIDVSKAGVEKFAIIVPTRTMEGQINYIYPFVAFASPPEGDSFVAMGINVAVEGGMDLRAVTLVPEDINFKGHKVAALVIRKNPLDGSNLADPIPVFILSVNLQTWREMKQDQQNRESVIFVPYGLQDSQDIRLPVAGKLAVPIAFIKRQVTEEPPTATKPATPTNTSTVAKAEPTSQNTPKPPTESAPPATAIPKAPATAIPEAPKFFITPGGHALPLGSHLDEFGNGSMYVTLILPKDPCPEMVKLESNADYNPAYENGGVGFMCFWDDAWNGGAWVDGRRLIYPPKQP